MSGDPARTFGPFSIMTATFIGLALVGFAGGAGMGWLSEGEAHASATEAPVPPSVHQSGLEATATATPSTNRIESAATPGTSTASVTSESLPSSASREPSPDPAQPPRRVTSPPAVGAPVAPVQRPAPAPYRPAPAPRPAPPPAPVPAPAPAVEPPPINIPLLPVNPQPLIQPRHVTIG